MFNTELQICRSVINNKVMSRCGDFGGIAQENLSEIKQLSSGLKCVGNQKG